MKSCRCRVVLLAFSAIVAAMIEPCGAQNQTLSQEALTNFQAFGSLGFPDIKGCPLVRVASGRYADTSDGIERWYVAAFLLATNGDSFKVLTFDLDVRSFTKSAPGTQDFHPVGFDVLNLRDEATDRRAPLLMMRDERQKLSWGNEYFVLAWACWRQGLDGLAQEIFAEAENWNRRSNGAATSSTFEQDIENELGGAAFRQAILSFGNLSITRPKLLEQFEEIIKKYPQIEKYQEAKEKGEMLKQMIAEDEEHARTAPKDLDQLPIQQRVRELIFQLRDRHVLDFGGQGSPDMQLVSLGYAAVPQLINAMSSPILTRSIVTDHHGGPWVSVLSVSDLARNTLRGITGKSWGGTPTEAQAAAQAWWDGLQNEHGKEVLVWDVSAGGNDAPFLADLLVASHPEVAARALMQGIKAADGVRTTLLEKLAKLPDDSITDFLRDEMLHGPQLRSRVAAAYFLRDRGKPETVTAMIQEWKQLPHEDIRSSGRSYQVHSFLASCDSVPAIDALTHNFSQRPAEERVAVVQWVGQTNRQFLDHPAEPQSPATLMAIEKFLVTALEDTEEWRFGGEFDPGMPGSVTVNGMSFCNPRICDIAAALLAEHWPARYPMQQSPTYKGREFNRIECLNTWRVPQQLPPLPLPQPRNTPVSPSDATKVTVIEWSPDSVKPSEYMAECVGGFKNKLLRTEDIMGLIMNFAHNPGAGVSGLRFQATKEDDLTGVDLTLTLLPGHVSTNVPAQVSGNDFLCTFCVQLGPDRLFAIGWFVSVMDRGREAMGMLHLIEETEDATTAPPKTPFEINILIKDFRRN